MHIPSHMVQGPVCPVTAAIALAGVAWAVLAAKNSDDNPSPMRFAGVTAMVFALQMFNFPIQDGTSGHVLGAVASAIFLGIPFGILSMTVIIVTQCLLFGDGGIEVLGANIITMALVASGLGGWLAVRLREQSHGLGRAFMTAAAAWASVVVAALTCSVIVAAGSNIGIAKVATAMLPVHMLIGFVEAGVTIALLAVIPIRARRRTDFGAMLFPYGIALLAAVILSQFSSTMPDGLEWAAKQLGILKDNAAGFMGLMPNYEMPGTGDPVSAVGLAGMVGVVAVVAISVFAARLWQPQQQAE